MNLNPIVLSIPVFFLLIGIELVVERLSHRKLYRFPDAIANLSCGITSQLSGLFMRVLAVGVYEVLFHQFAFFFARPHRLVVLGCLVSAGGFGLLLGPSHEPRNQFVLGWPCGASPERRL